MGIPPATNPTHRLLPIEGLRAYLAIWVLLTHVIFFSSAAFEGSSSTGGWRYWVMKLDSGPLAVQVFMIISGFVITLLLDVRRESYGRFITRRFFRLYPLYILLIGLSVAASSWRWQTFVDSQHYMTAYGIEYYREITRATWNSWWPGLGIHVVMLQGLPPAFLIDQTTIYSFIIAGWSISVEWEFYLLAPLIFFLLRSPSSGCRIAGWAGALFVYLLGRHMHYLTPSFFSFMPFFYVGIVSYFAYKHVPTVGPNTVLPAALGLSLLLFLMFGSGAEYLPFLIWIPFLGLLLEPADSISARCFLWIFNNPVAQFLGACSYGIYLSHELVILCGQSLLLVVAPDLGPSAYFCNLLLLTLAGTFLLSAALHYLVEQPGMTLGRYLANKIPSRVDESVEMVKAQ